MSARLFIVSPLLLLVACGSSSGESHPNAGEETSSDVVDETSDGAPDPTPEEKTRCSPTRRTFSPSPERRGASIAVVLHGKLTFAAGGDAGWNRDREASV